MPNIYYINISRKTIIFLHTDEIGSQVFRPLQAQYPQFTVGQDQSSKRAEIIKSKLYGNKCGN